MQSLISLWILDKLNSYQKTLQILNTFQYYCNYPENKFYTEISIKCVIFKPENKTENRKE